MDGRRRLDRILDAGYLDGLQERSTDEIRRMRDESEEEESGISFARRVLQGKLDILRAEALRRRDDGEDDGAVRPLLDVMPSILADEVRTAPLRTRVTRFLVPPSVQYHRREVERLAGEQTLASLTQRSTADLTEIARTLAEKERELSALRRELLDRIDALQDELARRYRDGEAHIDEVLSRRG